MTRNLCMTSIRFLRARAMGVALAMGAAGVGGLGGMAEARAADPGVDSSVADKLGLNSGRFVNVRIRDGSNGSGAKMLVDVDLGEGPTTLELDRYSVRAPGFTMMVFGESGAASSEAPPVQT